MDDVISSPASPLPPNRPKTSKSTSDETPLNLKGNQFVMPTPPDTELSGHSSPVSETDARRTTSPVPSSSALSSVQEASDPAASGTSGLLGSTPNEFQNSSSDPRPVKRRKLTPTEKLEQQKVKEAKALVKAEEKRVKDEEKKRKAEEKDAKRREKEVEEERKRQEKLKTERSQMRLGAFFQKPATSAESADGTDEEGSCDRARRRSLSLETFNSVKEQIAARATPPSTAAKATKIIAAPKAVHSDPIIPDYKKHFLPFDLQSHTTLASCVPPTRSAEGEAQAHDRFDSELHDPSLPEKHDLGISGPYASLEQFFSSGRPSERGLRVGSTRRLFEQIHGSAQEPIDLVDASSTQDPLTQLRVTPFRHLSFQEDIRPAYFGTYTRIRSPGAASRLKRNPFARERKDTDYDYDSEAEWEDPAEGEDIGNDDDDDESLGDVEDLDGFLDDEDDDPKNKRKLITGDLVPVSTGLCWEDGMGKSALKAADGPHRSDMRGMRLHFLLPGLTEKSINPFSSSYWDPDAMPPPGAPVKELAVATSGRSPLVERNSNSTDFLTAAKHPEDIATKVSILSGSKRNHRGTQKTLDAQELDQFKSAVVGSLLSKQEMSNALKTKFPELTAVLIKDTLGEQFAQVGKTKADKKWVYVGGS